MLGYEVTRLSWRVCSDWAKYRPLTLRLADYLGRGRGRLRLFDGLNLPQRAPLSPDLSNWESHDLAAAWIGHATILLRIGGMTVLTDPVLSHRVGQFVGGAIRLHVEGFLKLSHPVFDLHGRDLRT